MPCSQSNLIYVICSFSQLCAVAFDNKAISICQKQVGRKMLCSVLYSRKEVFWVFSIFFFSGLSSYSVLLCFICKKENKTNQNQQWPSVYDFG